MRIGVLLAIGTPPPKGETRWTMLNVSPRHDVADCHLIQLPSGENVLIDAGKVGDSPGIVFRQLTRQKIRRLDLVIISHFHIDHYGALEELIDAGIKIKRVAVNVPARAAAEPEMPWGCDLAHVEELLKKLRAQGIPYFTPRMGERLLEVKTSADTVVALDVVCLYDGLNTPIGRTDVNDTSIIVRLSHGRTRALFTGDLNSPLGTFLATSGFDLKADILKVPHHGAESLAPDEFFDRVGASAALVPSPKHLWASPFSMRTRNYLTVRKIPTYVSGLDGNVTVTMTDEDYQIETEKQGRK